MTALLDRLLRLVLTAGFALVKRRARRRPGVHAVALTPERRLVLVRLRYAHGWRLPGGGVDANEDRREAALRELAEEIGMVSHGRSRLVSAHGDPLLIVEDVRYRPPRWSWEVEQITEARLDHLPSGLAPITREWLDALSGSL